MNSRGESYLSHLVDHVGEYYPDLRSDHTPVRLVEVREGKSSQVFRFTVGSNGDCRRIMIKRPKTELARYRLAAQTDVAIKSRLEYEALRAIERHFGGLGDERFYALRPLGFIEQDSAVILEESRFPTLLRLFLAINRFPLGSRVGELDRTFRNAGSWLREYGGLPTRADAEVHDQDREAFEVALREDATQLGSTLGQTDYFEALADRTIARARRVLPERLPVALKHGDFAMRNLIVAPNGSVAGFDTQAKWRVPIYEDIALFLIELEANWRQVLTNGLAFRKSTLARYREQFLQGYFDGEPVPEQAVNLFMIKGALHRWNAHLYWMAVLRREGRVTLRRLMLPVSKRFFRGYVAALDHSGR